ncbi:unnamed protein product, partial [Ceratitis capitata]
VLCLHKLTRPTKWKQIATEAATNSVLVTLVDWWVPDPVTNRPTNRPTVRPQGPHCDNEIAALRNCEHKENSAKCKTKPHTSINIKTPTHFQAHIHTKIHTVAL